MKTAAPLADRLANLYIVVPNGCWIWAGSRNSDGYGSMTIGSRSDGTRRRTSAHLVSYALFVGPVPQGTEIDHTCRERACVNWRHLEAVTHRVNVTRGVGPTAINARRNCCSKCGKPFTVVYGQRGCAPCQHAHRIAKWNNQRDEIGAKRRETYRLKVMARNHDRQMESE